MSSNNSSSTAASSSGGSGSSKSKQKSFKPFNIKKSVTSSLSPQKYVKKSESQSLINTSEEDATTTTTTTKTSTTPQKQQKKLDINDITHQLNDTSLMIDHDIANETATSITNKSPGGRPCVVGVIGDSSRGKYLFLNKLVNDSVFHTINLQTNHDNISPEDTVKLEIYNDVAKENVYINLNSIRDTKLLVNAWELKDMSNSSEIEKWLDDADFVYLKYLLFMFHICNIIFLVFENLTMKLEYFNMFKILKQIKQSTSPSINNILSKHKIPVDLHPFLTPGRCIPILQVFLVKDLTDNYSREFHLKLEDGLKKQILTVLKNNGLLTSFSHFVNAKKDSNILFLIEMNRPLVRLIRLYQMFNIPNNTSNAAINSSSNTIGGASGSTTLTNSPAIIPNIMDQQQQQQQTKPQLIQKQFRFFSQLMNVYESSYHNIPTACINSYKQSLINLKCELPDYELWEKVVISLQSFFDQKENNSLGNIKNSLGVDIQFSTKNCQNYYKSALDQYMNDLPPIYGVKVHQAKLQKAIKTLSFYAAGPSLDQYIANLSAECEAFWKKGRKLCEAESITGRLCTHKTHPLPSKDPNAPIDPEAKTHHSGFRTLGSCNCGKTIKLREDIFDIDYGNHDYFENECCAAYQYLELPTTSMHVTSACSVTPKRFHSTNVPWFSLLLFGKSSLYNAQDGVPNDGYFVNSDSVLQDWDFKRIINTSLNSQSLNSSSLTSTGSSGSGSNSSNIKYEIGKLSFEYQCPLGHRFYEKRRSRKFFISSNSKNEFKIFYQRQLLESCNSSECDYFAQLMRVVMIPTIDLQFQPKIEIAQSPEKLPNKWEFYLDSTTPLMKDHFYSFRLPYAYIFDHLNLLRTYNCGLLNLYFTIPLKEQNNNNNNIN